jgi:hypothetical protein
VHMRLLDVVLGEGLTAHSPVFPSVSASGWDSLKYRSASALAFSLDFGSERTLRDES